MLMMGFGNLPSPELDKNDYKNEKLPTKAQTWVGFPAPAGSL